MAELKSGAWWLVMWLPMEGLSDSSDSGNRSLIEFTKISKHESCTQTFPLQFGELL